MLFFAIREIYPDPESKTFSASLQTLMVQPAPLLQAVAPTGR
jgi:hypothetical protein